MGETTATRVDPVRVARGLLDLLGSDNLSESGESITNLGRWPLRQVPVVLAVRCHSLLKPRIVLNPR